MYTHNIIKLGLFWFYFPWFPKKPNEFCPELDPPPKLFENCDPPAALKLDPPAAPAPWVLKPVCVPCVLKLVCVPWALNPVCVPWLFVCVPCALPPVWIPWRPASELEPAATTKNIISPVYAGMLMNRWNFGFPAMRNSRQAPVVAKMLNHSTPSSTQILI